MVTSRRAVRVVVADDQPDVREAVTALLTSHGLAVVAQAADAEQCVQAARALAPDVALVDVLMPGGGVDLVHALAALAGGPKVVVLSAITSRSTKQQLLEAGADAYLVKGSPPAALVRALLETQVPP